MVTILTHHLWTLVQFGACSLKVSSHLEQICRSHVIKSVQKMVKKIQQIAALTRSKPGNPGRLSQIMFCFKLCNCSKKTNTTRSYYRFKYALQYKFLESIFLGVKHTLGQSPHLCCRDWPFCCFTIKSWQIKKQDKRYFVYKNTIPKTLFSPISQQLTQKLGERLEQNFW